MDELDSEYGFESESTLGEPRAGTSKRKRDELHYKTKPGKQAKADRRLLDEERTKHMARQGLLTSMDPHSRHKHLINQYLLYFPGATKMLQRDTSRDQTDLDVIRRNHKFVWDESTASDSWETKLAKRYWDKLFKEYCIADLSRYKENKVGMRWRVEREVLDGKGQFICGNKRCTDRDALESWEVNFGYVEDEMKKNALVKLRLCPSCSKMLNYHQQRRKAVKRSFKRKSRSKTSDRTSASDDTQNGTEVDASIGSNDNQSDNATASKTAPKSIELPANADAWKQPVAVDEERSRDDEFEEFLDDLLV